MFFLYKLGDEVIAWLDPHFSIQHSVYFLNQPISKEICNTSQQHTKPQKCSQVR